MKQPPFHLRPNKAIDRLAFIDAIKYWGKSNDLSEYTYYGFGGWTLEDFRLIYEFHPEIKMISIEESGEVYKRQQFHIPCRGAQLKLRNIEFRVFLAQYEAQDEKAVFWLDYFWLKYAHFEEFMILLGKVFPGSIVKITLRCEPSDYIGRDEAETARKIEEFQKQFQEVLPHTSDQPSTAFIDLAKLLQDMVQIAAEKALSSVTPLKFVPISSFCYADGPGMFTLTGIVCLRTQEAIVRAAFKSWDFANLNWNQPILIDVPTLSTKERLHLQQRLPRRTGAGRILRNALGYLIEEDVLRTEAKLQQYANFHRYFPYFMKTIP